MMKKHFENITDSRQQGKVQHNMPEVKGCIITTDEMGCQKKIVSHECDYVLSLKGNQETLHEHIKLYFDAVEKEPRFYPL